MSVVSYQLNDEIGVIRIDNPPVNALSQAVRAGLIEALQTAAGDAARAVVILCEGRTFIAGADITEFGKPPLPPSGAEVLSAIENSPKPVVAAIHGTALGGGFEVSLACHYRCAVASARIGLPEVKLGILPGGGGTQRLTRLAGVERALDLMTGGEPIGAEAALAMGAIDRVVAGEELEARALEYARELVASGAPLKRVRDMSIDPASVPQTFFDDYRKRLERRARGQIAPAHIVSCAQAAVELPFEEGLKKERELFQVCLNSTQSKAMRYFFFAEREAAKVAGLDKATPVREVKTVGIIGAGTMGGGIAMNFANIGVPVKLLELDSKLLDKGLSVIKKNYGISVKRGKLTAGQVNDCLALITGTTDYDRMKDVDLVIEAVFEDLGIKQNVFQKLDAVCKPGCILASNTSYQNIDAIAGVTERPEDVIGLHFFSPANVMKLLEVVRGDRTADDVIMTAMKLARTINKVPVLARVCYGFIGNRMVRYYRGQAQLALMEGATPEQIDNAMEQFGMAMGPIAMGDLAGLDIGVKARESLSEADKGDPKFFVVTDALVALGRLGQKSGRGYYRYDPETRQRTADPEVVEITRREAEKLGIRQRQVPDDEIIERIVYALVNEGARLLEEGIAQRASDIDVVYVHGYGFPVARGGPMFYADTVGLPGIRDRMLEFRQADDDPFWEPAPLLAKLADEGGRFTG